MTPNLIDLIAAARPNFMKIAPLYHALAREQWCRPRIVHTGQHYDANMSDAFFTDLRMPDPEIHLNVGSGTHAEQTGRTMIEYERICLRDRPAWIVVVGDVNSTLACALVGAKLSIPVAHLEAGLRSGDRKMPEEINRIVTDAVADLLWTPSPDGDENLLREGVAAHKIEQVGNIMLDSFELLRPRIVAEGRAKKMSLPARGYAVVTLHRPSNVDDRTQLALVVAKLRAVAARLPIVFPVHPRTRQRLSDFGLLEQMQSDPNVHLTEPLSYVAFMSLVIDSRLVLTDSGGIQEETSYLGIPCLTVRENTERPVTVSLGTNRLTAPARIEDDVAATLQKPMPTHCRIPLWDGHTAGRIAHSLRQRVLLEEQP